MFIVVNYSNVFLISGWTNHAKNKPAYQISISGKRPASIAVDGSLASDASVGQCAITTNKDNPTWWLVDLQYDVAVGRVDITKRIRNGIHNNQNSCVAPLKSKKKTKQKHGTYLR